MTFAARSYKINFYIPKQLYDTTFPYYLIPIAGTTQAIPLVYLTFHLPPNHAEAVRYIYRAGLKVGEDIVTALKNAKKALNINSPIRQKTVDMLFTMTSKTQAHKVSFSIPRRLYMTTPAYYLVPIAGTTQFIPLAYLTSHLPSNQAEAVRHIYRAGLKSREDACTALQSAQKSLDLDIHFLKSRRVN